MGEEQNIPPLLAIVSLRQQAACRDCPFAQNVRVEKYEEHFENMQFCVFSSMAAQALVSGERMPAFDTKILTGNPNCHFNCETNLQQFDPAANRPLTELNLKYQGTDVPEFIGIKKWLDILGGMFSHIVFADTRTVSLRKA